jgi:hypothetical protein
MGTRASVEMYLCALHLEKWEPDEGVEDAYHRALNIMPDQFHDMRNDHGGAPQEKHAHEDVLVVDKSAHLPSFCAFIFKEDDPCAVAWIDFWAVEPCSNAETDYARGQKYAEEAISLVRATRQPAFIECVLIFIGIKLRERNQCAGELEDGFADRIVEEFPGVMERVLMRVRAWRPRRPRPASFPVH